ncbi:MAG: DUF3783 domain-containing protein [Lachnospiraceae bacterium]|nr:DUF3783 domain-containing protein [Lachnospiraceae bacterium]MDD6617801.1 DUF3783 domain-containing protein [Clostridiales bacterium]MDY4770373.1 DUF3783 domain-containing protein [Lachnospiraceae bacterium]
MKATVLLINFKDKQKQQTIQRALLPLGVKMKVITQEEFGQPIGYLAGMKKIASVEMSEEKMELEKEMLVFAAIDGDLLQYILQTLRKAGVPVDYKAVLTEHNLTWNCVQLYRELELEHLAYQQSRS